VQAHRSPAADRLAAFGYQVALSDNAVPTLATALVLSHLTDWPAPSRRMLNVVSGYAVANVFTEGIKIAAGRGRPRVTDDPRHFRPFTRERGWKSLPSGHASSAFGLMAALSREFDLPLAVEVLGYGAGGIVAWSRMYHDAHWPSDVAAGALIGIVGASTTVAWLQRRQEEPEDAPAGNGIAVPVVLVRIPLP
jgi:membrane-associated phospholipid phosphatase